VPVCGGYCVDRTEVTRAQYEAWLATSPSPAGQDPWCSWNTDFAPEATCMSKEDVCKGANCGNHPQVCVDWCDAYAYCKAVGKRMCGKIGGGAVPYWDHSKKDISQWFNVCSSGGTKKYPYGDIYEPKTCNGWDASFSHTTVEVATLASCQPSTPGYAGVYDLSGNVTEWEDSCTPLRNRRSITRDAEKRAEKRKGHAPPRTAACHQTPGRWATRGKQEAPNQPLFRLASPGRSRLQADFRRTAVLGRHRGAGRNKVDLTLVRNLARRMAEILA
jgi:formylglycine-generating enzyme required for sulfatase activity